jgi:hypothetical protein
MKTKPRKRVAVRPTDVGTLALTPVPNHQGYYIEPGGRIFAISELVPYVHEDGYVRVRAFISGKRKRPGVHVMKALAYLPAPTAEQDQVRHLDGNRTNNDITNLA